MRGGEAPRVIEVVDADGPRAYLVLDSLTRGPAFGGIRRRAYGDAEQARVEAQRLAEAMSRKCALAELAAGGGKTVILDHPKLDREATYAAVGRAVEALGGEYVCGPDVGTRAEDLEVLRRYTRWVNRADNDAGRSTAAGVLAGLRGLSRVVFESDSLAGRRYVIQGLGAVGSALAAALIGAGAEVAGWDPDPHARDRASALGVRLLDEDRLLTEPAEVFMPCALGQILDRETCERGPWKAVCGSANNQLVDAEAGAILHRRGVAWAPDVVVNAGAVIEGVETVGAGEDRLAEARERVVLAIEAIAKRTAEILEQSRREDRPPAEVTDERARAALSPA